MSATRLIVGLATLLLNADPPPSAPAPSAEAAGRMTVPEGFKVTLFAAEPDVHQPIAFTIDPRGRPWVVECYAYPSWKGGPERKDRVLIFEDTDGDGRHDVRKVFWEGGTNLTGIALGFGGVWLCSTPDLLFIPDKDGDDTPDGPPVVKLDGWDVKAQHNMFNALTWGPDGWLWGCNGIMSNSRVGAPGTPDAERTPINCGVWRFHPTRSTFEVVAHGTTNPWGLDFDGHGEAFITNCVIPHLYRVVPGAHFQRMYGQDFNPHSYALMESCADHLHWAGGRWQDSRSGKKHGEAGGGHAHAGAMIYLGDNWPHRYRGTLFTCNIHGRRVNNDRLRGGLSGYVATHEKDFLLANDPWFRGLELKYGPDGGVFMTDWSDTGECHETDDDGSHRENGRIYKITYGDVKPARVDLAKLSDAELVALQDHSNEWHVRTARRLLQERAVAGGEMKDVHRALWAMVPPARAGALAGQASRRPLRALWALHVTGGLDEGALRQHLNHPSDRVRAWIVRLLAGERSPSNETVVTLANLARADRSELVHLYLASSLQRLPLDRRWDIAEGLVSQHGILDHDVSLMVWYGVEPLVAADRDRALRLAERSNLPIVSRFIARRAVAADAKGGLAAVVGVLDREPWFLSDILAGALEALRGQSFDHAPEGWPRVYDRLVKAEEAEVRERAVLLALHFGDPKAIVALRSIVTDRAEDAERRKRALSALTERRVEGLAQSLHELLDDDAMRGSALRALAGYADPATPSRVLDRYPKLAADERADAVTTLAARPESARALLDAMGRGVVPKRDVDATTARQILALGDARISGKLAEVWGTLRPTSKDKAALMSKYKAMLTPDELEKADPSRGRLVFNRACLSCHKMYDAGGDVGPDLTGSDRANLDYVLENVLDPSASVGRDFQLTTIATSDGRTISGIVREQTDKALVVQTVNDRLVLPREEIDGLKTSPESMMPEGLFETLSSDEVRDLIAYLAGTEQVPTPATGK